MDIRVVKVFMPSPVKTAKVFVPTALRAVEVRRIVIGSQGARGETGATGAPGPQGEQGFPGEPGAAGATGAAGVPSGIQQLYSATGDAGALPAGSFGFNGSATAFFASTVDVNGGDIASFLAQFKAGDQIIIQGPDGAAVTGNLTSDGWESSGHRLWDFVLTSITSAFTDGHLYGVVFIAKGAAGATGAKGDTGATGPKGDTGAPGADGNDGAVGPTGPKGDTGATGPKGDTGATGAGNFTYSATAPVSPNAGDRWYDSANGVYLIYINDGNTSQWVETGNNSLPANVPVVIEDGTGWTVGATTSEVELRRIPIKGGSLGPKGSCKFKAGWSQNSNANNKTDAVYINNTADTPWHSSTHTTQKNFVTEKTFFNRNSESSQVGDSPTYWYGSPQQTTDDLFTSTYDTSVDFDIVICGKKANAGDTLKLEFYQITIVYGA